MTRRLVIYKSTAPAIYLLIVYALTFHSETLNLHVKTLIVTLLVALGLIYERFYTKILSRLSEDDGIYEAVSSDMYSSGAAIGVLSYVYYLSLAALLNFTIVAFIIIAASFPTHEQKINFLNIQLLIKSVSLNFSKLNELMELLGMVFSNVTSASFVASQAILAIIIGNRIGAASGHAARSRPRAVFTAILSVAFLVLLLLISRAFLMSIDLEGLLHGAVLKNAKIGIIQRNLNLSLWPESDSILFSTLGIFAVLRSATMSRAERQTGKMMLIINSLGAARVDKLIDKIRETKP